MCDMCNDPNKMNEYMEALERNLQNGLVKVGVDVEIKEGQFTKEWLWCEPVDDGLLKVCNVPFFTEVCCIDDIIEAKVIEDFHFEFLRTVERMTEGIYLQYDVEDMEIDEIGSRYNAFANACREHNFIPEAPVIGFTVVAVPYGETEEAWRVIQGNAKTAGLDLIY